MPRAQARLSKGKAPMEESVSRPEVSKRTERSESREQTSRTRQRRDNKERLIEERIAAAVEKAMQQWTTQAAVIMQGMWERNRQAPPQGNSGERPGPSANPNFTRRMEDSFLEADRKAINSFLAQRPPKFAGEPDPIIAEQWILEIKKLFKISPCNDQQKVLCATHLLVKDAYEWWETLMVTMPHPEQVTWQEFLEEFNKEYLPVGLRSQKVIEFEKLYQGKMTVTEYATRFNALVRYVPWIANVPENKAQRFQRGLRPQLREGLAPLLIKDYASSIERARALEGEFMRTQELREAQKKIFPTSQESEAKKEENKKATTGKEKTGYTSPCKICHKHHSGECLQGLRKCFKCGRAGHVAQKCNAINREGC